MFITVEGPDGSGKTTALTNIKRILEREGYQVLLTREPGGEKTAEKIRSVILHADSVNIHPWTEALLYLAARKEHMDKIIQPALRANKIVISDRYVDSTLAYQGYGRGLGQKELEQAHQLVLGEKYLPDLTLYFDVSVADQNTRLAHRWEKSNRFDRAQLSFKEKVLAGYRTLARLSPNRIKIIDASRPVNEVREELEKIILNKVRSNGK